MSQNAPPLRISLTSSTSIKYNLLTPVGLLYRAHCIFKANLKTSDLNVCTKYKLFVVNWHWTKFCEVCFFLIVQNSPKSIGVWAQIASGSSADFTVRQILPSDGHVSEDRFWPILCTVTYFALQAISNYCDAKSQLPNLSLKIQQVIVLPLGCCINQTRKKL